MSVAGRGWRMWCLVSSGFNTFCDSPAARILILHRLLPIQTAFSLLALEWDNT